MSVVAKQCPGIDDRAGIDCDFAHAGLDHRFGNWPEIPVIF